MSKRIALWSHPRSMSTSLERYFRERGDCRCHHEPFMYYYYLVREARLYPDFNPEPERPRQFKDIATMLTETAAGDEPPHCFFKDMSYYLDGHLCSDIDSEAMSELAEKTIPIFLIRDPRFSIASYHRLDPDFSLHEVGLEAEARHYDWLLEQGITPLVIEASKITENPELALREICRFADIPFIAEAMHWDASTVPEDWQQVAGWHQSSMKSTGFSAPGHRDPDAVFNKAAEQAPHLRDYLAHHQPFYEKLRSRAWRP